MGHGPNPTRRPTVVHHINPLTSSPVTGEPSRRVSASRANGHHVGVGDDDVGLVMREKGEDSIGKAGGVGVGVTRPKRRLSSLPSLPHPFLSQPNYHTIRAYSVTANSSPPASPNSITNHHNHNHNHHHVHNHVHNHNHHYQPQTTYQALVGGASSQTNYQSTFPRVMEGHSSGATATTGRERDGPPMLFGIELKWISLITLALQNAFLTIIMHYSRITTSPNKTYSAATAVLLNELLKGSISFVIALGRIDPDLLSTTPSTAQIYNEKDTSTISRSPSRSNSARNEVALFHPSRIRVLLRQVLSPDCYKLSIPAILYVIQNNLQYVAASNLDVATFQVTYQMKILTTAFFSVLLLRKRLSKGKWASLCMLAVGVGIVQLQSTAAPSSVAPSSASGIKISHNGAALRSEIPEPDLNDVIETLASPIRIMRPFRGFMAVTLACLTSGLAGVYFEFILKGSSGSTPPPDLWVRNTQLSLFSLVPAIIPILVAPSGAEGVGWLGRVMASFSNFNGWAIGTVLTQTLGGLITAVVIRYSDNIMKGFATSLSIIISFLASVALFSYPITLAFIVGSSIVLLATYLYNAPTAPTSSSSTSTRTTVAVHPGSPISTSAPILGEPEKPSRASSVINLLGLGNNGSSSAGSSRKPSLTDLRSGMGGGSGIGGFTPVMYGESHAGGVIGLGAGYGSGMGGVTGGYHSASAPGSPYFASGFTGGVVPPRRASPRPDLKVDVSGGAGEKGSRID